MFGLTVASRRSSGRLSSSTESNPDMFSSSFASFGFEAGSFVTLKSGSKKLRSTSA